MARASRAKVSKTSGQGVKRLSYQKGYDLSRKNPTAGSVRWDAPEDVKLGRQYGKGDGGKINVSYGDTLAIGDLSDIEDVAKRKPAKGLSLVPGKGKKFK